MTTNKVDFTVQEKLFLAEEHIQRLQKQLADMEQLLDNQLEYQKNKDDCIIPVVGQLAYVIIKLEDNQFSWKYAVVQQVFDGHHQLFIDDGSFFMSAVSEKDSGFIANQEKKREVIYLFQDEKPVIAKRHWKKGYLPQPK